MGFEIRGDDVVLREFTSDDAPAVLAYHRDPEVMRLLPPAVTANRTLDAIGALIRAANDDALHVPRVRFDLAVTVDRANVASMRVLEKAGLRSEGVLERNRRLAEGRDPSFVYVLRREEWTVPGPPDAPI